MHNHLGRIREQLDSIRIESVNHFRDDLNLCKNHLMLMRSGEQQGTVVFVEGGEGLWTEPFVKRLSAELRDGLGEVTVLPGQKYLKIYEKPNAMR